jgi:hypothetical protein
MAGANQQVGRVHGAQVLVDGGRRDAEPGGEFGGGAARRAPDLPAAGRVVGRAGTLLAVACGLYAAAASRTVMVAVVVLTLATVAHTLAEILSEAGNWTLAFELADPTNAGAYQGVSQTGAALGSMLAPALVTATASEHGFAGWAVLAALFLAAGLGTAWLVGRAPRSRPGL